MLKGIGILVICGVVIISTGISEGIEVKYSDFESVLVKKVLRAEKDIKKSEVEVIIKNYKEISKKLAGYKKVDIKPYKNMKLKGDFAVLVEAVNKNGKIDKYYLWVKVKIIKSIYKANNLIKRRSVITREDLIKEKRDISELHEKVVINKNDIIGKEAKFNILPGRILLSWMVREVPLVRNRDEIVIVARNKEVEVTAQGIALEDGNLGEEIKVKNISSDKMFVAKVIGEKKVVVNFE